MGLALRSRGFPPRAYNRPAGPDSSAGQSDSLLRSRPLVRIQLGASVRWGPLMVGLLLAGVLAGCGGSSSSGGRAPPDESTDAPAPPPPGWSRIVNGTAGFSLSLPPGWTTRGSRNGSTLVRSSDRALAVAVSADRSDDGTRDLPTTYLQRTVRSLSGYRNLRANQPRPVPGLRYSAARVEAS